jgi:hypothetical protein
MFSASEVSATIFFDENPKITNAIAMEITAS